MTRSLGAQLGSRARLPEIIFSFAFCLVLSWGSLGQVLVFLLPLNEYQTQFAFTVTHSPIQISSLDLHWASPANPRSPSPTNAINHQVLHSDDEKEPIRALVVKAGHFQEFVKPRLLYVIARQLYHPSISAQMIFLHSIIGATNRYINPPSLCRSIQHQALFSTSQPHLPTVTLSPSSRAFRQSLQPTPTTHSLFTNSNPSRRCSPSSKLP